VLVVALVQTTARGYIKRRRARNRLRTSLAYDIVKAHGGEIKVETKEGDGTQFIIVLK
jgi:signal transduction histidine kinase